MVRADDVDLSGVMIRYTGAGYGFDGPGTVKSKETGLLIKDSWAGTGHLPEHRVDGRPYVTEALLVSSPADGEAYRIGEKIRLQMTFTEPMDVVVRGSDDTVFAGLYVGFVDQNWREAWRSAIYEDGAATSTFTFAYTVKATDVDNNGVRIVPGTNTTGFGGGGNIVSVADNTPSSDWYEGSWHLTSHKVNGQPSVGGGAAFDLDDANDGAWDAWVGSEMVLVVDQGENKIFAYDDGGRREPSRDIDLDQSGGDGAPEVGTTPTGIWSEGETVWVAFQDRNNIFAYNLADGTRNADKEIPLEGAGLGGQHRSLGIWSGGTTMWVMNSTPFKILAFDLESKTYDSGKTFTPPHPAGAPYSGGEVTDLWSDGTTVWLPDSAEGKLYAHRLNDGSQDSDKDISVTLPQDQNGISGVSVSSNHMWVVSRDSDDTTFNLTKYNVPSLIDTSPFLSGVRVVSTPEDGETYTSGGLIEIDVAFSHPVRLFGRYDPGLLLMVGDPRLVDPVRPAYLDRSDQDTYDDPTGKLKFIYRVQDGDYSPDGVNINRRRLDRLTEDAILGSDGEVSVRDNYQGLVVKRGHPVDARAGVTSIKVASTPASPGAYRVGEVIKIELAYAVPVEAGEDAAIYLQLNEARDNRLKGATYSAGNGTDTLTFSYTVKAGDVDTDGLTIVGSVGDAVGQEREIFVQGRTGLALREYEFQNNIAGQSVDGLSNAIQTGIISTPELGDAYGPGEEILVKITFDQDIGFEVGPILQLEIGDHVRQVTVDPEQRSYDIDHLLFPYTVQDSDHDSDGIVILSQFVSESDRYLYDAGSSTGITVEAIPSGGEVQTGHKVLLPATIQSIDLLSDPGGDKNYIIGDRVEVGVTFDQAMTVTGTPSLGFETTDRYGETEVLMEYDRTAGEGDQEGTIVVFAYTVAEGDSADEGIYIPGNAFRLDEGDSLTGPEGNPANLDHEIFNHPDSHFIDATRPTFGSAETSTLGKEVRVRFSETVGVPPLLSRVSQMIGLDLGVFYAAVLDVTVDGKPVIPGAASISDNTLTLGMPDESQIQTGQVVKVSYDNIFALDAPGLFVDSKGNALNSFGPQSVQNSSEYNPGGDNSGLNAPRLVLSQTQIRVPEESSVTYTVAMAARDVPEGFKLTDATVNIASLLANDKLTVTNSTLTFTEDTWTTPQTVTLTAAADGDSLNYWVTLAHTVTGGWLVTVPGSESLQIVTPEPVAFHVRVVVDDDE